MAKNKEMAPPIFSKWRAIFWPIRGWEGKKVIPLALMMACILFNYSLLRGIKDALIITAGGSGVEVINFIKVWVVVPSALFFFFTYAKLSNHLNKTTLFYVTLIPFIIFFAAFAFWIYPNREIMQPSMETIEALKLAYPRIRWVFPIYGHWTYVTFYIASELWVSVVLNLLFWQFANDITRVTEAKRFYALLGLIGSFFVFVAGRVLQYFSDIHEQLPEDVDAWGVSLKYLMTAVVGCGFLVIMIYYWIQKVIVPDPIYCPQTVAAQKKPKYKISFVESMRYVFFSKYLGYIALLVICYGVTINLIETTWKHQLKLLHTDPNSYGKAMGVAIEYVGLVTMVLTLVGANVLRMFSWQTAAVISPIVFGITGVIFFAFILFQETFAPFVVFFGMAPVAMAAWLGTAQNVFSKSTKYALFDPTKEMAYIPLDDHLKMKGKAAVDVVGGRLGKSGGALVQQGLIIAILGSDQMTITPYLSVVVVIMVFVWIFAVRGLSRLFYEKEHAHHHSESESAPKNSGLPVDENALDKKPSPVSV